MILVLDELLESFQEGFLHSSFEICTITLVCAARLDCSMS